MNTGLGKDSCQKLQRQVTKHYLLEFRQGSVVACISNTLHCNQLKLRHAKNDIFHALHCHWKQDITWGNIVIFNHVKKIWLASSHCPNNGWASNLPLWSVQCWRVQANNTCISNLVNNYMLSITCDRLPFSILIMATSLDHVFCDLFSFYMTNLSTKQT